MKPLIRDYTSDKVLTEQESHHTSHSLNQQSKEDIHKITNNLELVKTGYANGVAEGYPLNTEEKEKMIKDASYAFGLFLDALKCDWKNDPNSLDTPNRVAKAYVNDLWAGRYNEMSPVTSFPSDGYDGIVIERNIPLSSMCSHHHQTIRWFYSYWLYYR